jgi:hypothetical protein
MKLQLARHFGQFRRAGRIEYDLKLHAAKFRFVIPIFNPGMFAN